MERQETHEPYIPLDLAETVQQGHVCTLFQAATSDSLMASASWQQAGHCITVSFDVRRGAQLVRLHR